MERKSWVVGVVVIGLGLVLNACSSKKPEISSSVQEDTALLQVLDGMKRSFLPIFCQDGTFFRECYSVTPTECEAEGIKAMDDCLNPMKMEIAQKIKQNASAEEGRVMGEKAGSCSAIKLKERLQAKWINSEKCNDPTQWQ